MSARRNHDERREQIAEATWAVIERVGLARANLRLIAREGGWTTGVLSHYFTGKQDLLAYAFGLVVDRQAARILDVAPREGLRAALAEMLPLDAERRRECVIWLALTTESLQAPDLAAELARRCKQSRTVIATALVEAGAAGAEDADDLADEMQAVIDGITVSALGQPASFPPGQQRALLARALARVGMTAQQV